MTDAPLTWRLVYLAAGGWCVGEFESTTGTPLHRNARRRLDMAEWASRRLRPVAICQETEGSLSRGQKWGRTPPHLLDGSDGDSVRPLATSQPSQGASSDVAASLVAGFPPGSPDGRDNVCQRVRFADAALTVGTRRCWGVGLGVRLRWFW